MYTREGLVSSAGIAVSKEDNRWISRLKLSNMAISELWGL